ncbi:MAG: hypothetical protein J6M62_09700 [Selenomonadaceae bacterium]|nr:hypothetical protein [Selenomonadaceae bacterium]
MYTKIHILYVLQGFSSYYIIRLFLVILIKYQFNQSNKIPVSIIGDSNLYRVSVGRAKRYPTLVGI